jgi:hypothetical protein
VAAVKDVIATDGLEALARLATKTAYSGLIGRAAAAAMVADEHRRNLLAFFLDRADGCSDTIVRCFVEELFKDQGISLLNFIAKYACRIDGRSFGVFAQGLPVCPETWDAVEARGEEAEATYWKSGISLHQAEPKVERAIRALLHHGQVATAADAIAYSSSGISSEVILETLKRVPAFLNDSADTRVLNEFTHRIERLFEILDENRDMSDQDVVNLEMKLIPLSPVRSASCRSWV